MAEAIASDAATVTHWRTHVVRHGAHPRPVVAWPEALAQPAGRVRVIFGAERGHMQLQTGSVIGAAYPTAAGCRRQGRRGDVLGPWLDASDTAVTDVPE